MQVCSSKPRAMVAAGLFKTDAHRPLIQTIKVYHRMPLIVNVESRNTRSSVVVLLLWSYVEWFYITACFDRQTDMRTQLRLYI